LIEYARFVANPVGGWSQSAPVPGAVDALYPEVVIDELARVTVVWHQYMTSLQFELKSTRFAPATGWGSVRHVGVSLNVASGGGKKLAIDPDGRITAIWTFVAGNSGQWAHYVARNDPGTDTWGAPVVLASGEGFGHSAQLAIDVTGNVLAAWEQPDGATTRAYFARFDKAAGAWSAAREIPGTLGVGTKHFAPLPNGDFLGVWSAALAGGDEIARASRYRLSTDEWLPAVNLSTPADDVSVGDVESDALGNAFVTWEHANGTECCASRAAQRRLSELECRRGPRPDGRGRP
jgi:hypothetical protein